MTSLRLAIRQLLKTPGFTLTALVTLALCLGANLAIYAVIDAVLLRGLPYRESDRLVAVFNGYPGANVERAGASLPNYYDRRHSIKAFSSLSSFQGGSLIVGGGSTPQRTAIGRVTPEFFDTLGVKLAKGEMFTDEHMLYATDQVAILTDAFWRAHFNADPDIVGKTFLNDGLTITIRGVLPPGFRFLDLNAQFYRPFSHAPEDREVNRRHSNNSQMIARLAPGVSVAEAQAQMDAFNAEQMKDEPFADLIRGARFQTSVRPLHADYVRDFKPLLLLLQGGVLLLLAIGAVNLTNLLLIRASGRTKELAVRQALGARSWHITRDVLVETLVLSLVGGLLGLLLGNFGISALRQLGTDQLPLGATITFDLRVALVSLLGAMAVGVILALPIVWFNLRTQLASSLQAETRGGTAGRGAHLVRHGLIVAQVTIAFVLLSSAGLFGLSLKRLLDTPTGFNAANILTGQLALPWNTYRDGDARLAFMERLLPAVRQLPGVTHVAFSTYMPFSGGGSNGAISVEGHVPEPGDSVRAHYLTSTSPDFWPMMQIPLLRGRLLEDADNRREQRVCVVDEAFARRYWPDGDPLGRRLTVGPQFIEDQATTVVGVVGDIKQNQLSDQPGFGTIYFPAQGGAPNFFSLMVRTTMAPESFGPTLQKAILQLDPELPIDNLRTLESRIDDSLLARRSPAILVAIFASVALALAALGTYGVLAYAVSQREREIGVRMAVGAEPRQILAQFFRLGLVLLALGLVLGSGFAWLVGWLIRSQLYEVSAVHPGVLAATAGVMLVVVLLAVLLPSRRAARVNPLDALRAD